jgi:hypothetical protein
MVVHRFLEFSDLFIRGLDFRGALGRVLRSPSRQKLQGRGAN